MHSDHSLLHLSTSGLADGIQKTSRWRFPVSFGQIKTRDIGTKQTTTFAGKGSPDPFACSLGLPMFASTDPAADFFPCEVPTLSNQTSNSEMARWRDGKKALLGKFKKSPTDDWLSLNDLQVRVGALFSMRERVVENNNLLIIREYFHYNTVKMSCFAFVLVHTQQLIM